MSKKNRTPSHKFCPVILVLCCEDVSVAACFSAAVSHVGVLIKIYVTAKTDCANKLLELSLVGWGKEPRGYPCKILIVTNLDLTMCRSLHSAKRV